MLSTNFPSADDGNVDTPDADALLASLKTLPFWGTSAFDYPRLLVTSREHSAVEVLSRLDIHRCWASWTFLDKFACLAVSLGAASRFLNAEKSVLERPSIKEDVTELHSVIEHISDLLTADVKNLKSPEPVIRKGRPGDKRVEDDEEFCPEDGNEKDDEPQTPMKRKIASVPQDPPLSIKRRKLKGVDKNFDDPNVKV